MPLPGNNVTPPRNSAQDATLQQELAQGRRLQEARQGTHNAMPVREVLTEANWRELFSELMDRTVRDEANGGIHRIELDMEMRALIARRPTEAQAQANAQADIDRRETQSDAEVQRLFADMDGDPFEVRPAVDHFGEAFWDVSVALGELTREVLSLREENGDQRSSGAEETLSRLTAQYAAIDREGTRGMRQITQLHGRINAALQSIWDAREAFLRPVEPAARPPLSIPMGFNFAKYYQMIERVDALSPAERAARLQQLVHKIIFIELEDGEPEQAMLDASHEIRLLEANLSADVIKKARERAEQE